MNKYPDFWSVIAGKGPIGFFLGYIAICYVCAFASMLIEMANRDVTSANTPIKVSWKFFTVANLLRIITNILLIPIAIRAIYEYIPPVGMLFVSIGVGAGADRLAMLFKKLGVLTTDKLAAKVADKLAPEQPTVIPPVTKP